MRYSSQEKQLSIDAFRSSLTSLSKSNRWRQLDDTLPWDEIENLYSHRLNNGKRGAGNKPARMIIGALLIKHKMNLSGEKTIWASMVKGYTFVDHHSWEAYNESADLVLQIDLYRQRFGFLPTRIYADNYMQREPQADEGAGRPSHGKAIRKAAKRIKNGRISIPNDSSYGRAKRDRSHFGHRKTNLQNQ